MIIGLAVLTSNTSVYSQKKSKKNSVTFDEKLHESVEYREIGPLEEGVLQLLLVLKAIQNYFILEQLEVVFGKLKMEVKPMKIFQMDFLEGVLVQLLSLKMIQM